MSKTIQLIFLLALIFMISGLSSVQADELDCNSYPFASVDDMLREANGIQRSAILRGYPEWEANYFDLDDVLNQTYSNYDNYPAYEKSIFLAGGASNYWARNSFQSPYGYGQNEIRHTVGWIAVDLDQPNIFWGNGQLIPDETILLMILQSGSFDIGGTVEVIATTDLNDYTGSLSDEWNAHQNATGITLYNGPIRTGLAQKCIYFTAAEVGSRQFRVIMRVVGHPRDLPSERKIDTERFGRDSQKAEASIGIQGPYSTRILASAENPTTISLSLPPAPEDKDKCLTVKVCGMVVKGMKEAEHQKCLTAAINRASDVWSDAKVHFEEPGTIHVLDPDTLILREAAVGVTKVTLADCLDGNKILHLEENVTGDMTIVDSAGDQIEDMTTTHLHAAVQKKGKELCQSAAKGSLYVLGVPKIDEDGLLAGEGIRKGNTCFIDIGEQVAGSIYAHEAGHNFDLYHPNDPPATEPADPVARPFNPDLNVMMSAVQVALIDTDRNFYEWRPNLEGWQKKHARDWILGHKTWYGVEETADDPDGCPTTDFEHLRDQMVDNDRQEANRINAIELDFNAQIRVVSGDIVVQEDVLSNLDFFDAAIVAVTLTEKNTACNAVNTTPTEVLAGIQAWEKNEAAIEAKTKQIATKFPAGATRAEKAVIRANRVVWRAELDALKVIKKAENYKVRYNKIILKTNESKTRREDRYPATYPTTDEIKQALEELAANLTPDRTGAQKYRQSDNDDYNDAIIYKTIQDTIAADCEIKTRIYDDMIAANVISEPEREKLADLVVELGLLQRDLRTARTNEITRSEALLWETIEFWVEFIGCKIY